MNILLTSVGRRVKLVRYFQRALEGTGHVLAVDCDESAPALYIADYRERVPRIDDPQYISVLLELCDRYKIQAVLSLIDPELSLLAANADRFHERNVRPIIASATVTEICLDKQKTHDVLKQHGISCVPTYSEWGKLEKAIATQEISFPLIVKPKKGSASLGVQKVSSMSELSYTFQKGGEVVVQPFITGQEFGVDLYVDLISGTPVSIFTRQKLRMRAGETDRSLAVKEEALTELIHQLTTALKLTGPNDIDCFQMGDRFVISEINPRFGGGYPHAYECGENFVQLMVRNLEGKENTPQIGSYSAGSVMIKYDEVLLLPQLGTTGDH